MTDDDVILVAIEKGREEVEVPCKPNGAVDLAQLRLLDRRACGLHYRHSPEDDDFRIILPVDGELSPPADHGYEGWGNLTYFLHYENATQVVSKRCVNVVISEKDSQIHKLACSDDGTLALHRLKELNSKAIGLQYRNVKTGRLRQVQLDGDILHSPGTGWGDTVYILCLAHRTTEPSLEDAMMNLSLPSSSQQQNVQVGNGNHMYVDIPSTDVFKDVIHIQTGSNNRQFITLNVTYKISDDVRRILKEIAEESYPHETFVDENNIVIKITRNRTEKGNFGPAECEVEKKILVRLKGPGGESVNEALREYSASLVNAKHGCIELQLKPKSVLSLKLLIGGFLTGHFSEVITAIFDSVDILQTMSELGELFTIAVTLYITDGAAIDAQRQPNVRSITHPINRPTLAKSHSNGKPHFGDVNCELEVRPEATESLQEVTESFFSGSFKAVLSSLLTRDVLKDVVVYADRSIKLDVCLDVRKVSRSSVLRRESVPAKREQLAPKTPIEDKTNEQEMGSRFRTVRNCADVGRVCSGIGRYDSGETLTYESLRGTTQSETPNITQAVTRGMGPMAEDLIQINKQETTTGDSVLHKETSKGNVDAVMDLLNRGAQVNVVNKRGESPFYVAVKLGNMAMVKTLMSAGADLNTKDKFGWTCLHIAADLGHLGLIIYLVSRGCSVRCLDKDGCSPLHIAARRGHTECIAQLVSVGIPVSQADKEGRTPLHHAMERRKIDSIHMLLLCGASPDVFDTGSKLPAVAPKFDSRSEQKIEEVLYNQKLLMGGYIAGHIRTQGCYVSGAATARLDSIDLRLELKDVSESEGFYIVVRRRRSEYLFDEIPLSSQEECLSDVFDYHLTKNISKDTEVKLIIPIFQKPKLTEDVVYKTVHDETVSGHTTTISENGAWYCVVAVPLAWHANEPFAVVVRPRCDPIELSTCASSYVCSFDRRIQIEYSRKTFKETGQAMLKVLDSSDEYPFLTSHVYEITFESNNPPQKDLNIQVPLLHQGLKSRELSILTTGDEGYFGAWQNTTKAITVKADCVRIALGNLRSPILRFVASRRDQIKGKENLKRDVPLAYRRITHQQNHVVFFAVWKFESSSLEYAILVVECAQVEICDVRITRWLEMGYKISKDTLSYDFIVRSGQAFRFKILNISASGCCWRLVFNPRRHNYQSCRLKYCDVTGERDLINVDIYDELNTDASSSATVSQGNCVTSLTIELPMYGKTGELKSNIQGQVTNLDEPTSPKRRKHKRKGLQIVPKDLHIPSENNNQVMSSKSFLSLGHMLTTEEGIDLAAYLGVSGDHVTASQSGSSGIDMTCFYLLQLWRKHYPEKANVRTLVTALHQIERVDLAEVIANLTDQRPIEVTDFRNAGISLDNDSE